MKQIVEDTLHNYPLTRNSDEELVKHICRKYGKEQLRIFESVRRTRQKFNEQGLYLPTDLKIAKQRRINEEVWLKAMGYNTNTLGFGY